MGALFSYQYLIAQAAAMFLTAILIPGLRITGIGGAFFAVIGITLFNAYYWDAELFSSLPFDSFLDFFSLRTLILFVFNAAIFWIVIKIAPGIEIKGFIPALVAPVIFTVSSIVIEKYGKDIDYVALASKASSVISGVTSQVKDEVKKEVKKEIVKEVMGTESEKKGTKKARLKDEVPKAKESTKLEEDG